MSDRSKCPRCGDVADNGHDRELPPNPYLCKTCQAHLTLSLRDVLTGDDRLKQQAAHIAQLEAENAALKADAEQAASDFNAAIDHAISLGSEGVDFLRYWREGDWDACAQFDFVVSEELKRGPAALAAKKGGA